MDAILQRCIQVPVLENIESQAFHRKFYNQLPLVLKKAVKNWRPCQIWSPDYLKTVLEESFDSLQVLEALDNTHFINNSDFASKRAILPGTFVDYVFNNAEVFNSDEASGTQSNHGFLDENLNPEKKRLYLRTMTMPDILYRDIATADQIESLKSKIYFTGDRQANSIDEFTRKVFRQDTMQLWIGTSGNITPLHYDRNHGLLVQIRGVKSVILFSHEHTSAVYPFPSYSPKSHLSRINFRNVKDESELLASFPKFSRAQPYSCVISPGDILYTPPFWWHDVTSRDNCVSVTLPWDLDSNDEIPPCMLR